MWIIRQRLEKVIQLWADTSVYGCVRRDAGDRLYFIGNKANK